MNDSDLQRRPGQGLAPFKPPLSLRNQHVQSLLNSSALRRRRVRRRAAEFLANTEQWILDGGDGIRLQGYFNAAKEQPARGLAVLLHGWEGSAESNYLLSTAVGLQQDGFDVFRLNFRDHGDSHHLNEGLFHSRRLDEVIHAIGDLARRHPARPLLLAGYSLGGNFALRVARHAPKHGVPLERVVAVCPVIDPDRVLTALEEGLFIYHHYFVRKWRRSLARKQQVFPQLYEFSEWFKLSGLRAQTQHLVDTHTPYVTIKEYLDGYNIGGDYLHGLEVPATLLAAADDPVIPIEDVRKLEVPEQLEVLVTEHGGHCGYLTDWRFNSWAEQFIRDQFSRHAASGQHASDGAAGREKHATNHG